MPRNFYRPLASALLATSALAGASAQALTLHLLLETSGTSQVIEVIDPVGPKLRFSTVTEGQGTLSLTGYVSTDVVDLSTGQGSGSNRFIASNGDELWGSFTVQVIPQDAPGAVTLQGLTQFTGGSGIFAGASGSATLSGFGQFISETQALVQFVHQGQVSAVPEPGGAALLLAGLAAGAALLRRRPAA